MGLYRKLLLIKALTLIVRRKSFTIIVLPSCIAYDFLSFLCRAALNAFSSNPIQVITTCQATSITRQSNYCFLRITSRTIKQHCSSRAFDLQKKHWMDQSIFTLKLIHKKRTDRTLLFLVSLKRIRITDYSGSTVPVLCKYTRFY